MPPPLVPEGIKKKAEESEKQAEEITSSKPKAFFWDRILLYLASTIFLLSVSGVVIDFFKSSENSLACFTPLENRAQYTYINSYCHKHLPVADYFSVALVIQATALFIPHYLWKVLFSAKFDSFFSHATKLDTLCDRDMGECLRNNYSIVDYLWKEFRKQNIILTMYVTKLLLQFLLMLTSLVLNIVIFTDINFNITFECHDDNERSQLFGNVTCAYPKKLLINVLQVADYLLLSVAMMVLGFGLCWCVLFNHSLEDKTAQFCYDSCIDAEYYKSSKPQLSWNKTLKNDFKFLVDLLLATNAGLGRLLNSLQIKKIISQKFNTQIATCGHRCDDITDTIDLDYFRADDKRHNRPAVWDLHRFVAHNILYAVRWNELGQSLHIDLDQLPIKHHTDVKEHCKVMLTFWLQVTNNPTWDQLFSAIDGLSPLTENENKLISQYSMGWNVPAAYQSDCDKNNMDGSKKPLPLRNEIYKICKEIRREQWEIYHDYKMGALDIACGYHSYLFDIAEWYKLVVPIILGSYSRNQAEIFEIEEHGDVNIVRMPANLFNSPSKPIQKFSRECSKNDAKFSLVVVGPMDNENKLNSVNEILKIFSKNTRCFRDGSVILYLKPLKVQGVDDKKISEYFTDWEPELTEWVPRRNYGERTVKCGDLNCKFEFKTFRYEKTFIYERKYLATDV